MPSLSNSLEIGDLSHITTYQAAALQAAAQRAIREHCDKILSPYGITKTQWLVIGLALDAGNAGIRLTDLCRRLDLTPTTLNNIINVLERQNMLVWVSRRGKQRAVTIHPTFARDCPEIEWILRSALRSSIYATIAPLELRIYLKVLYQLAQLHTSNE
jgi:DNA-binding MarR family transcriptional regulator